MAMLAPTALHPVETDRSRRADASSAARSALDLQAALLSHSTLSEAGAAWVREIATRFEFDRVSLGLRVKGELRVQAVSTGLPVAEDSPGIKRLSLALAEALDQSASVMFPETRVQSHPRITLAHSRLVEGRGGSAASVPLVAAGASIGALCVERSGAAISATELETIEHLACLAAPVLRLMQLNQRTFAERMRAALREAMTRTGKTGTRWAIGAGTLALALLTLLPLDWHVGGHARLEGTVQRVLVAPSDGFLRQVHARPGEKIHAGQVLVELAEQDLRLEQQRWQSQLSQHENAYAAANAHADRAQQVIQQGRAAEAEAQLELVQMKIERGRIEAPFDGIVVQGDLSQSLGAPLTQGAELMTVAPMDKFRVIVEVDERDIAAVAIGQSGSLALSALPWNSLPIRVTRITPTATPVEGHNVFEVEAELLARGADLRPGLQGTAHILAGRQPLMVSASHHLVDGLRLMLWEWWG